VATRTVLNLARNEKQYSVEFLDDYFDGKKDMAVENEFNNCIEEKLWLKEQCTKCLDGILHCLNNKERLIFILRDIINLRYDKISEITDKNNTAVRKTNSRNRQKLKNFLQDHCMLFNPNSKCSCRMKKAIDKNIMKNEISKLKKTIRDIYEYCDVKNEIDMNNLKSIILQYCQITEKII
jgi:RNA polymerase sigma-70 factor (ECF subfamily)